MEEWSCIPPDLFKHLQPWPRWISVTQAACGDPTSYCLLKILKSICTLLRMGLSYVFSVMFIMIFLDSIVANVILVALYIYNFLFATMQWFWIIFLQLCFDLALSLSGESIVPGLNTLPYAIQIVWHWDNSASPALCLVCVLYGYVNKLDNKQGLATDNARRREHYKRMYYQSLVEWNGIRLWVSLKYRDSVLAAHGGPIPYWQTFLILHPTPVGSYISHG